MASVLFLTYCSAQKAPIERGRADEVYASIRVRAFVRVCRELGAPYGFVSGLFGIVMGWEEIPRYDHRLTREDIERLLPRVRQRLRQYRRIVFYKPRPLEGNLYLELLRRAAGRRLRVVHRVAELRRYLAS